MTLINSELIVDDELYRALVETMTDAITVLGVDGTVLVVVGRDEEAAAKAFRNIPEVQLVLQSELNAYDVLCNKYILFSKKTLPTPKAKAETGAAS